MDESKRRQLGLHSRAGHYLPTKRRPQSRRPCTSSSFHHDAAIYQDVVNGARETANIYEALRESRERQFQDQLALLEGPFVPRDGLGHGGDLGRALGLLKQGDHVVCDWTTYSSR